MNLKRVERKCAHETKKTVDSSNVDDKRSSCLSNAVLFVAEKKALVLVCQLCSRCCVFDVHCCLIIGVHFYIFMCSKICGLNLWIVSKPYFVLVIVSVRLVLVLFFSVTSLLFFYFINSLKGKLRFRTKQAKNILPFFVWYAIWWRKDTFGFKDAQCIAYGDFQQCSDINKKNHRKCFRTERCIGNLCWYMWAWQKFTNIIG